MDKFQLKYKITAEGFPRSQIIHFTIFLVYISPFISLNLSNYKGHKITFRNKTKRKILYYLFSKFLMSPKKQNFLKALCCSKFRKIKIRNLSLNKHVWCYLCRMVRHLKLMIRKFQREIKKLHQICTVKSSGMKAFRLRNRWEMKDVLKMKNCKRSSLN